VIFTARVAENHGFIIDRLRLQLGGERFPSFLATSQAIFDFAAFSGQ
jgi:hypothetical protein